MEEEALRLHLVSADEEYSLPDGYEKMGERGSHLVPQDLRIYRFRPVV